MQQELIDEQNAEMYGTVMKSEWDKYNAKYKNKIKYAPYQIPDKVAVFEGKNQISVPFFKMYGTTDHIQKAFDYINNRRHMAKVITEAGDADKYPELVRQGNFEVVAITSDAYENGYRAYANGGYLNYLNDLLTKNGFDITKLTQYQKELIVMPTMEPENYHMDGEITVAQAMRIWLGKLSDAGLGRQNITKAVKMNFSKAADGSKIGGFREFTVEVIGKELEKDGGHKHRWVKIIPARNEADAVRIARENFYEDWKLSDISFFSAKVIDPTDKDVVQKRGVKMATDGIKVGTGVFGGKENWRVTDGVRTAVYPKDKYSEKQAVEEFSKYGKADNGMETEKAYQIYDKAKDIYFSIGMDGKHKWFPSPDMGYTYTANEAEKLKEMLMTNSGYTNLEVVKYNKDWWKNAADGADIGLISKIESDGIISSKFGDSDMESIIYQYGAKIYQIITKSDGEKIIYDITPDESFIDEDDYMPARYKNGGEFGETQYYIVKAWDTDEDQRKGVAPEESKYGTRSEAVKWANHYHYEENFGVVEVEDENGNRVLTLNAYAKDGKMMVDFEVELGAEPNPDFDQNSHEGTVNIKKHRVRVKNMQEAKDKVVKFIMDNDLGSGNWVGGDIYQYGKKVGYISYNGRVWDNQGNSIAKDGTEIPERYRNMGFTKVGVKKNSTRPGKKWMVLAKKGDEYKVVHGGYEGMEDYSQHHDKLRRKRFWTRMGGFDSKKANDPFSPLYWHKKFGTWEDGGEA